MWVQHLPQNVSLWAGVGSCVTRLPAPSRRSLVGLHEQRLGPRRMFAEAGTAVSELRGHAAGGPWSWSGRMRAAHGALGGWGPQRGRLHWAHSGSRACPPRGPSTDHRWAVRLAPPCLAPRDSAAPLPCHPWGPAGTGASCHDGGFNVLGLPRASQPVQLTGRGPMRDPGKPTREERSASSDCIVLAQLSP